LSEFAAVYRIAKVEPARPVPDDSGATLSRRELSGFTVCAPTLRHAGRRERIPQSFLFQLETGIEQAGA
jgi:hypothetical protein